MRSRGPSRRPAVPDSQLPVIEKALLKGADAHGFDADVWTAARVAVVIQQVTGVQLGAHAVQRLLHERLGWSVQPVPVANVARSRPRRRRQVSRPGRVPVRGQR